MIATVAAQQSLTFRRQRVASVGLATMLAVTVMAGVLGWSSQHTIVRVFDEATRMQAAAGQPAPPNPFLLKPALSLLSNMVVYVPLIGALLALVVGHLTLVEDQTQGTGRLVFCRQVSRTHYGLGKFLSGARFIGLTLAASGLVSVAALLIVNRTVSPSSSARLVGFYALSWAYLAVFLLVGMLTAVLTRRRSLALLSGIAVWLVVTFVIPQLTSGLHPTQSLNPLSEPVGSSQTFFQITQHFESLSIAERYKAAAGVILDTAPRASAAETVLTVAPIVVAGVLLLLLVLRLVQLHDYSGSATDE